jgi:hypothetical protein
LYELLGIEMSDPADEADLVLATDLHLRRLEAAEDGEGSDARAAPRVLRLVPKDA